MPLFHEHNPSARRQQQQQQEQQEQLLTRHRLRRSASASRSRPNLTGNRPSSARASTLTRNASKQGLMIPTQLKSKTNSPSQYLFEQLRSSNRSARPGTAPSHCGITRHSSHSRLNFVSSQPEISFSLPSKNMTVKTIRPRNLRPTTAGPLRTIEPKSRQSTALDSTVYLRKPPTGLVKTKTKSEEQSIFTPRTSIFVTFNFATQKITELEANNFLNKRADIVQLACSADTAFALEVSGDVKLVRFENNRTLSKNNSNNNGFLSNESLDFEQYNNKLRLPRNFSEPIVSIACGAHHCIAVLQNGRAAGWGANRLSQLGRRSPAHISEALVIPHIGHVRSASCGPESTMLLLMNGKVVAMGDSSYGQLGIGPPIGRQSGCCEAPTCVMLDEDQILLQVSQGARHAVFLTVDHQVLVCGDNQAGRLGVPPTAATLLYIPTAVSTFNKHKNMAQPRVAFEHSSENMTTSTHDGHDSIVHVAAGGSMCVAVSKRGLLYTWGTPCAKHKRPQLAKRLANSKVRVSQVACGNDGAVAVSATGNLFVWRNTDLGVEDEFRSESKSNGSINGSISKWKSMGGDVNYRANVVAAFGAHALAAWVPKLPKARILAFKPTDMWLPPVPKNSNVTVVSHDQPDRDGCVDLHVVLRDVINRYVDISGVPTAAANNATERLGNNTQGITIRVEVFQRMNTTHKIKHETYPKECSLNCLVKSCEHVGTGKCIIHCRLPQTGRYIVHAYIGIQDETMVGSEDSVKHSMRSNGQRLSTPTPRDCQAVSSHVVQINSNCSTEFLPIPTTTELSREHVCWSVLPGSPLHISHVDNTSVRLRGAGLRSVRVGETPTFVIEHTTVLLDAQLPSQNVAPRFDPADFEARLIHRALGAHVLLDLKIGDGENVNKLVCSYSVRHVGQWKLVVRRARRLDAAGFRVDWAEFAEGKHVIVATHGEPCAEHSKILEPAEFNTNNGGEMILRVAFFDSGSNPYTSESKPILNTHICAASSDPSQKAQIIQIPNQLERILQSNHWIITCNSLTTVLPPQFKAQAVKIRVGLKELKKDGTFSINQLSKSPIELDLSVLTASLLNMQRELAFVLPFAETTSEENATNGIMIVDKQYRIQLKGVGNADTEVIIQAIPHTFHDKTQNLNCNGDGYISECNGTISTRILNNTDSMIVQSTIPAYPVDNEAGMFEAIIAIEKAGSYELRALVRIREGRTCSSIDKTDSLDKSFSCFLLVYVLPAAMFEFQETGKMSERTEVSNSGFFVSWKHRDSEVGSNGSINSSTDIMKDGTTSSWILSPASCVRPVDASIAGVLSKMESRESSKMESKHCEAEVDEWLVVKFETEQDMKLNELMEYVRGLGLLQWESVGPVVPVAKVLASVLGEFVHSWQQQVQQQQEQQRQEQQQHQQQQQQQQSDSSLPPRKETTPAHNPSMTTLDASSILADGTMSNNNGQIRQESSVIVHDTVKAVVFKLLCQCAGIPCRLEVNTNTLRQNVYVYIGNRGSEIPKVEYLIDLNSPIHTCSPL